MPKTDKDQLSQPLQRLEAAIDGMRRAIVGAHERLGSGLQVSKTQLEILKILARQPAQTTGELARRLFLTQSAVTQTVDTLVRRELVARHPDEHDRRIVRLRLSSGGQKVIDHALAVRRRHLQELVTHLSENEVEALISATEKVAAFIESSQYQNSPEN